MNLSEKKEIILKNNAIINEKADKVYESGYEAGQKSMVDESKIIEATATAENILALDDVSEIPHDVTVTVKSKNLLSSPFGAINVENGKTYTLSFKLKEGVTLSANARYSLAWYDEFGYWNNDNLILYGNVERTERSFTEEDNGYHSFHIDYSDITEDVFEYVQLEEGDKATKYVPFIADLSSVTVRVYGKNLIDISADPRFTKQDDGSFVNNIKIEVNKNNEIPLNLPYGTYMLSYDMKSQIGDNARLRVILKDGTQKDTWKESTGEYLHFETLITGEIINWGINYGSSPEAGELFVKNVQLEFDGATKYEPYLEPVTLSLDEEGKATTKSMSPNMTFISSVNGVLITADYHKSYGMQTEQDKVWDTIQNYGQRTNYSWGFGCSAWNDSTFKPKYDIRPVGASGCIFRETNLVDLEGTLQRCGVVLDTSQVTSLNYAFYSPYLRVIPTIDMTKISGVGEAYLNFQSQVVTIRKIIVAKTTPFHSLCFRNAPNLENLIIEGVIGQNDFNVQWSPKLSHDSIVSIINALSTTTSGLTVTLSKTAVNNAFETSAGAGDGSTSQEWLNLIAKRNNWTISLM